MEGDLQKYKAFVTTVECGSFTKAAVRMGFVQSSVSKMIADLEQELGLRLLERNRAGIRLTPNGETILPEIRGLLREYTKVREQAEEIRGVTSGSIRIGAFSSVATYWIPNIIREYQKDFPLIDYEVLLGDYDEVEHWILEGRVDCGFLRLPVKTNLETISLEMDSFMAVLPKGHALAGRKRIKPHDLDGQPFMLLEHGGRNEVTEFLEEQDTQPKIRFTSWDDYAILSMVEQGLGIGILPEMILQRIPFEVEVRPLSVPLRREIGLAVRNMGMSPAAMKRFIPYMEFRHAK